MLRGEHANFMLKKKDLPTDPRNGANIFDPFSVCSFLKNVCVKQLAEVFAHFLC